MSSKIPRKIKDVCLSGRKEVSNIKSDCNNGLSIGDYVLVNERNFGSIAYLGETKLGSGIWAGVILDNPVGKHNGTLYGVTYFKCATNSGIFCLLKDVKLIEKAGRIYKSDGLFIKDERANLSRCSVVSEQTCNSEDTLTNFGFSLNKRVTVSTSKGVRSGMLRFIGRTHFAQGVWVGIELDTATGRNDGSIKGYRYFTCRSRHGIFAPLHKVSGHTSSRNIQGFALQRSDSKYSIFSNVSAVSSIRSQVNTPNLSRTTTPISNKVNKNQPGEISQTTEWLRSSGNTNDFSLNEPFQDGTIDANCLECVCKRSKYDSVQSELGQLSTKCCKLVSLLSSLSLKLSTLNADGRIDRKEYEELQSFLSAGLEDDNINFTTKNSEMRSQSLDDGKKSCSHQSSINRNEFLGIEIDDNCMFTPRTPSRDANLENAKSYSGSVPTKNDTGKEGTVMAICESDIFREEIAKAKEQIERDEMLQQQYSKMISDLNSKVDSLEFLNKSLTNEKDSLGVKLEEVEFKFQEEKLLKLEAKQCADNMRSSLVSATSKIEELEFLLAEAGIANSDLKECYQSLLNTVPDFNSV